MTIRSSIADLAARVVLTLPGEVGYRMARRVVDRRNGDNDFDWRTNGEMNLLRAVAPFARVVFDVGANVGDWAAAALALNPTAEIHCFEPSLPTFEALRSRTFPPNVHLSQTAVGAAHDTRTLFVVAARDGGNSLYERKGLDAHAAQTETVAIETIDAYCASQGIDTIDVVKVDVEGHELAVLHGAARMLASGSIGVLQLEYGGTYIDAATRLKDVWESVPGSNPDYEMYKIFPDGLRRMPAYRQAFETFQYSNWVIAHRRCAPLLPVAGGALA